MRSTEVRKVLASCFAALAMLVSLLVSPGSSTAARGQQPGQIWQFVPGTPPPARAGAEPAVKPKKFKGYRLGHAVLSGRRTEQRQSPQEQLTYALPAERRASGRFP